MKKVVKPGSKAERRETEQLGTGAGSGDTGGSWTLLDMSCL